MYGFKTAIRGEKVPLSTNFVCEVKAAVGKVAVSFLVPLSLATIPFILVTERFSVASQKSNKRRRSSKEAFDYIAKKMQAVVA